MAIPTLSPVGTFRVSVLVGFVCPCIMLCLWRVTHRLAARRLDHCVFTCRVAVLDPETSRDHLLITCSTEQLIRAEILRTQSVPVQIVFDARVLSWKIVL